MTLTAAPVSGERAEDGDEHRRPQRRAQQRHGCRGRHDVGVAELEQLEGEDVVGDPPAYRGPAQLRSPTEAGCELGALEQRRLVVGRAQRHFGGAVEAPPLLEVDEVRRHGAQPRLDLVGEPPDGVMVLVGHDVGVPRVEVDRLADPHEDRRAEGDLVREREPDGDDADAARPRGPRPRTIRAAPVRTRASWGRSWVVPSGKIATAAPRRRARKHSSKALMLAAVPPSGPSSGRRTRTTPTSRSTGRRGQILPRPALATNRGARGRAAATTTGSTNPLKWLATMSIGRLSGSRSSPTTSTRRKNACTRRRATADRPRAIARLTGGSGPRRPSARRGHRGRRRRTPSEPRRRTRRRRHTPRSRGPAR